MTRPELRVKFRVAAQLAQIATLRRRLEGFLDACGLGLDERARMEVTLALDEAATNIVLHGYGKGQGVIDIEYENTGDALVIRLWDDGIDRRDVDCTGLPPGVAGEGGMGTNIMRATMSSVVYEKVNGRNLLEMRRGISHGSWTGRDKKA